MKNIFLLSAFCFLLPFASMAQDDFGVWTELGVAKSLPKGFSVALDGEVRTEDASSKIDRMNIGVSAGYKLNKYVKFGLGYQFMGYYSAEKTKAHYKEKDDGSLKLDNDGNPIWNGYNQDVSHWTLKHRLNVEVTGSYKPVKWLKLSLRERYQMTYAPKTTWNEYKYRFDRVMDGNTGEYVYEPKDDTPKIGEDYSAESYDHMLRSRLKIELDKKKCKWGPYVSAELHNNLTDNFYIDKVRTILGCDYRINRHHTVGLGYVLTFKLDRAKATERVHALSIGYQYSF